MRSFSRQKLDEEQIELSVLVLDVLRKTISISNVCLQEFYGRPIHKLCSNLQDAKVCNQKSIMISSDFVRKVMSNAMHMYFYRSVFYHYTTTIDSQSLKMT